MNMTHTADSESHGPETTTLLELVSVVSDLTGSDQETIQVVRHMLQSQNFSFARQPYTPQLN